jgi:myosin tail region-interacting protein MTI1
MSQRLKRVYNRSLRSSPRHRRERHLFLLPHPNPQRAYPRIELPSIPASSLTQVDNTGPFSAVSELSESWADVSGPPTVDSFLKPLPGVGLQLFSIPEDLQLSPEELMMVWGKIGVHICEAATTLYDKSKKTLIGDGTFHGFVDLAIKQVPSARYPLDVHSTYGYPVYQQTAGQVQKRVADIMPGDIVWLSDARFKGHKGLQTYHINVGEAGVPLVGVVTDFDQRKSKLRVLQANQHVGQQVRPHTFHLPLKLLFFVFISLSIVFLIYS